MNLFITSVQLFTSQDVNWWTGDMWRTCEWLWCFYQLFEWHSDGTHSLQRIHSWASDVILNFSKSVLMKKQTHLHLFQLRNTCLHFNKFSVCICYSVTQLGVEAVVASILHLTVLPKVDFFSSQVTLFTFLQDRDTVLFNMGSAMINGILECILSLRSTSDILISLSSMKTTVDTHNCYHYCWHKHKNNA